MGHELRWLTKAFGTTKQSCVLLRRLGGPIGLSTCRFVGVSESGQTIGMTVTRRTSGCRSGCAWPAPANHDTVVTATRGAAICKSALDAFGRVDILVNSAEILRDNAFHKMDPHMIDSVIGVYLNGALFVGQPVPRRIPCGSKRFCDGSRGG